jgi:hypothetical protein
MFVIGMFKFDKLFNSLCAALSLKAGSRFSASRKRIAPGIVLSSNSSVEEKPTQLLRDLDLCVDLGR